jgi:hypothetical protein
MKRLTLTALLALPSSALACEQPFDLLCSPAAPPAPALAAGFTAPVISSDFTSPAYADPSTWLQCLNGPKISNPIWYQGGVGMYPPYAPCPTITSDGTVPQVLQILWRPVDAYGSGSTQNSWNWIETSNNGGVLFPNYYFEVLARATPVQANAFIAMLWTLAGPDIEFDGAEIYTHTFTDGACTNNWRLSGAGDCLWYGTPPPNYSNFDVTQYHKYGQRVTGDGRTAIYQCSYIDDILQGCRSIDNATTAQITTGQIQNGLIGNGYCCTLGQNVASTLFTYVQWVHIWSCSDWQSSPCFTSSPNP